MSRPSVGTGRVKAFKNCANLPKGFYISFGVCFAKMSASIFHCVQTHCSMSKLCLVAQKVRSKVVWEQKLLSSCKCIVVMPEGYILSLSLFWPMVSWMAQNFTFYWTNCFDRAGLYALELCKNPPSSTGSLCIRSVRALKSTCFPGMKI